jgi:hypothetical protein
MILNGDAQLEIGKRMIIPNIVDRNNVCHQNQPVIVCREATEAEWRAYNQETGVQDYDPPYPYFYEFSTD